MKPTNIALPKFKEFSKIVRKTLKKLVPHKPRGPHHERFSLVWIMLLRYLLCFSSEKHFLKTLKDLPWLAKSLGVKRVPAQSVFTDFRGKIGSVGFQEIFSELAVKFTANSGIIAVDSSFFKAFANKYKKSKSDVEAAWLRRKTKMLYGYKLHLLVDAERELPLAFCVTPANVHDSQVFQQLIEKVEAEIALADAAYDSKENKEKAFSNGMLPIIPKNKRRSKRRKRFNTLEQLVYYSRVGVERVFSRLKLQHALDLFKMRGLDKAAIHAALSLIALLFQKVIK